jgi:PIN domain nuclease of toxin-antitoxin system
LFKKIHESENFAIIPLDSPALQKMISLRDIPELHDKIIVSTAKYLSLPLITRDDTIRAAKDHLVVKLFPSQIP